jgi:hypothetical protein
MPSEILPPEVDPIDSTLADHNAVTSLLDDPAQLAIIGEKLDDLIQALASHPGMQQTPYPNPTVWMGWDYTSKAKYILSELGNIQAGRPVAHPDQIPDYRPPAAEGMLFIYPSISLYPSVSHPCINSFAYN